MQCDLIFVLAGRPERKIYARELYRNGVTPALLLSTGRFEVRAFALLDLPGAERLQEAARNVPPKQRHFFVKIDASGTEIVPVARGRFGTLSEIRALAAWLNQNPGVHSLSIVSSGSHLPRVRLCCGALISGREIRYIAAPLMHTVGFPRQNRMLHLLQGAAELLKFPLYALVLAFRILGSNTSGTDLSNRPGQ